MKKKTKPEQGYNRWESTTITALEKEICWLKQTNSIKTHQLDKAIEQWKRLKKQEKRNQLLALWGGLLAFFATIFAFFCFLT